MTFLRFMDSQPRAQDVGLARREDNQAITCVGGLSSPLTADDEMTLERLDGEFFVYPDDVRALLAAALRSGVLG